MPLDRPRYPVAHGFDHVFVHYLTMGGRQFPMPIDDLAGVSRDERIADILNDLRACILPPPLQSSLAHCPLLRAALNITILRCMLSFIAILLLTTRRHTLHSSY